MATDMPSEPFVVSNGSATIDIKPDLATIHFQVQVTELKSTDAMEVFAERSEFIKKFLLNIKLRAKSLMPQN
ncbi:hypothetical protein PQO03_10710 [Lentisphaera profundi]|uniref:Uncharacterized protein n=1 Tax=Lentisphaera profundi TaxID=1658616 RepID=A0ABY7VQA7_9BACT|nr:hypothetical protein [Lentisphaera profundi]WDE96182.1 hypothetical protein PQO03_10710 [Lentisphaera profundi]